MCESWGYAKLHEIIQKRAIAEMKHAETLIGRILFLEGTPVVTKLNKINIGSDVPKMMAMDHAAEMVAIKGYNAGIKLAAEVADNATKEILEHILKDEDDHIDEIEEQKDQIGQMGIAIYLSTKR
jgi:bacterioferritin